MNTPPDIHYNANKSEKYANNMLVNVGKCRLISDCLIVLIQVNTYNGHRVLIWNLEKTGDVAH